MNKNKKQFLTGSQVVVQATIDAGAQMMYGYPITPTTEVFTGWIGKGQNYLQTEDEISAGFCVNGAILAGQRAFTATAGPGHVLMQDALSMAEGMRLPFVEIVGMRGGPSSGTVIYSQQEVTLACYGGNGEGMRLVYSPSNLQELYDLTIQAFNDAWKYKFPAIVLTDGYLLKTRGVYIGMKNEELRMKNYSLLSSKKDVHLPSIYTLEEELYEKLLQDKKDYEKIKIADSESLKTNDAEILIIAHGIVGAATKQAVIKLRKQGKKVGLFRPITLRPFDNKKLNKLASRVKKIVVVESSLGQLERIVRSELDSKISVEIKGLHYPGLGVEVDQIKNVIARSSDSHRDDVAIPLI